MCVSTTVTGVLFKRGMTNQSQLGLKNVYPIFVMPCGNSNALPIDSLGAAVIVFHF